MAQVSSHNTLSAAWAKQQNRRFTKQRANKIARNAVTSMDIMSAARDISTMRTYTDTYGIAIPKVGEITNQRHSGRCWMFASYNVARQETMKFLDVDTFEFSQAYGMFYDKLEKANATLEYIISTRDKDLESREVEYLLDGVAADGGYFFYAMNLIRKWGVVPKEAMPETACSENSEQMDNQLARLLHKDIFELRTQAEKGASVETLHALKDEMLKEVYTFLCICLGNPPESFDLHIEVGSKCKADASKIHTVLPEPQDDEKDDSQKSKAKGKGKAKDEDEEKDHKDRVTVLYDTNLTPQEFTEKYVPFKPDEYIQLTSIPSSKFEYNKVYHVQFDDSVLGGFAARFLNVEPEVLEQAAINALKDGRPVSMACDVCQQFPRYIDDFKYILATDTVDMNGLFGIDFDMSRPSMVDTHETGLTHAMTFQGVQLDKKGKPQAWRIENSWGKDAGKDGYLIMSADWFRLYGGEIDIARKYLSSQLLDIWDNGVDIEVMPWSNMGRALNLRKKQGYSKNGALASVIVLAALTTVTV